MTTLCSVASLEVVDLLVDLRAELQRRLDEGVAAGSLAGGDDNGAIAEQTAHDGLLNFHALTLAKKELERLPFHYAPLEDEAARGDHILLAPVDGHRPHKGGEEHQNAHGQFEDELRFVLKWNGHDCQRNNAQKDGPHINDGMELGLVGHFFVLHQIFFNISHGYLKFY